MRTYHRLPPLILSLVVAGTLVCMFSGSVLGVTLPGTPGDSIASLIYDSVSGDVTLETDGYSLVGLTIKSAGKNLLYREWTGPKGVNDFFTGRTDLVGYNGFFSGATVSSGQSVGLILPPELPAEYLLQDLTITYFKQGVSTEATGDLIVQLTPATVNWLGQDAAGPTDWGIAGNWESGVVPDGQGQQVTFGGAGVGATADLIDADRIVGGMAFLADTNTLVRSTGAKTLTLNNGEQDTTVVADGQHTVSASLLLAGNAAVSVTGASSLLTISGNISEDPAGKQLSLTGGGVLRLSGTNVFTGGTTVEDGTLEVLGAGSLPSGGGLTIGSGGTVVLAGGLTAMGGAAGVTAVPEPGSLALLAVAAVMLAVWRRRR